MRYLDIYVSSLLFGVFKCVISDKCTTETGKINSYLSINDITSYSFKDIKNIADVDDCTCDAKCLRKCCAYGYSYSLSKKLCVIDNDNPFRISKYEQRHNLSQKFYYVPGISCKLYYPQNPFINPNDTFYLTEHASLWIENVDFVVSTQNFCVDYFEGTGICALICFPPESSTGTAPINIVGMIISMPFLLATFVVYALIPEKNLPAKALMCYVISLLFAYILLVTIQLHGSLGPAPCATIALLCYFFFMVSFFWMNSSCIDIWLTFSGIRGLTGSKKRDTRRFLYYSAYAWGVPLLLACIVIGITYGPGVDQKSLYHTGIGDGQCWFGSGIPTFIYFYLPITILLTVNIVLFAITAYKIQMVRKDTAMLRRDESQKSRLESDRQRFNLYVKLLLAMGINWTMEVISWALTWKFTNIPDEVWYLTDFCNALYGVFIFFIFVFKKNIWIMLKKRYLSFTGKPQLAHSLGTSTTRTTCSSSTKDGQLQYPRINAMDNDSSAV